MARRSRIRQIDIDFLCLSIFGQRSLPDEMAERIAQRRDFYDAINEPLRQLPDLRQAWAAPLEAVGRVGWGGVSRCVPCQSDHHLECTHSLVEPCDCFVCIAERIGDEVIGETPPSRADHRDEETDERE